MSLDLEPDIKGMLPEKDFDRRDFMWTALGASAAVALANSASGQQIVTDSAGIDMADVMIPTKDAQLRAYRAMPDKGGPFPVVLVAAEVFGLNPYMRDVCRRLAKVGYYAIVPDLYTRTADLTKISNMAEIVPIVNAKRDTELVSDYDATVDFARTSGKADVARMGITGFCRGGRTTLIYAAANPKLKAAVALRRREPEAESRRRLVWVTGGCPARRCLVRRWIASPKSRCRCWDSTAARTPASPWSRSRSSSRR